MICKICWCGFDDDPNMILLTNCSHMMHKECAIEKFEGDIAVKNFPIMCPEPECEASAGPKDLKPLLAKESWVKYNEF